MDPKREIILVRNSFILLLALLAGCATSPSSPGTSRAEVRNERCLSSSKIKVFQVMDDGILAHLCPIEYSSIYKNAFDACVIDGDIVYMPVKRTKNDYVDDQKVSLPEHQCFAADGTYSYVTAKEVNRRVRKIKIIDSQVPTSVDGAEKKK